MQFKPFVLDKENQQIPAFIVPMSQTDAEATNAPPVRQISFRCGMVLSQRLGGERFYEIFFQMCRKYGVRWASADEKERRFIEEVTRVTYERERAVRLGLPLSDVRPAFAS